MKRETVFYCHEFTGWMGDPEKKVFLHFFPNPFGVSMCDGPEKKVPVFKVLVSETKDFHKCYWAWWDNGEKKFHHVYPTRDGVEICFPYGTKAETDRGRGKVVPVSVEKMGLIAFDAARGYVCLKLGGTKDGKR